MCPSYMATRDEEHSTRGRANALRAVLSGQVPAADFTGKRLYEVMDLCLECKGCKAECPSNVDMAKMKYEFLHHYHQVNGLPLRNRLFGHIARALLAGLAAGPALQLDRRARCPNRWLMERVVGHRPAAAAARLRARDLHRLVRPAPARRATAPRGRVVLFHDTFVTYNTPEIGRAAVELLEAAGYRVELVDRKCCGRPLISKGMLDEAQGARASGTWRACCPGWTAGVPIVGLEPSCLLTLRDEYVELLRTDEARRGGALELPARGVPAARAARAGSTLPLANGRGARRALLHGHCHQKAMVGTAPTVAALRVGGLRGERGGLGLLRHGGLVRLRDASTTTSR